MVSADDRSLLERLRRSQTWKVADAAGLTYPPGAPKTLMIELLKAAQVDPRKYIEFVPVHGRDENGNQTTQYYPTVPDHQTARSPVDAEGILANKIAVKDEEKPENSELGELRKRLEKSEARNEKLSEQLESLIDKLGSVETPAVEIPTPVSPTVNVALTIGQKKQVLAQRGIDPKGMSQEEIDAALEA